MSDQLRDLKRLDLSEPFLPRLQNEPVNTCPASSVAL